MIPRLPAVVYITLEFDECVWIPIRTTKSGELYGVTIRGWLSTLKEYACHSQYKEISGAYTQGVVSHGSATSSRGTHLAPSLEC